MPDFCTYAKRNGTGPSSSYSFGFLFVHNGSGNELSTNVDVFQGEVSTPVSAFNLAKQRAANVRRDWLTELAQISVVGQVVLPDPE